MTNSSRSSAAPRRGCEVGMMVRARHSDRWSVDGGLQLIEKDDLGVVVRLDSDRCDIMFPRHRRIVSWTTFPSSYFDIIEGVV